jgi:hypothetical protein
MTIRNAAMFDGPRPTLALRMQWAQKGALQPIVSGLDILEQDRSATRSFRLLWAKAFPDREPLPYAALAEKDGKGSIAFWDAFG